MGFMKDKEIEEKASKLSELFIPYIWHTNDFMRLEIAQELLKHYQPKLPENAVVMTREELKELKKYKIDWLNSEKIHLQGELEYTEFELSCANKMYSTLSKLYDEAEGKLKKYNEFNNNLTVENQKLKDELTVARKETAKEIYRMADEICTGSQNDGDKILAMIKDKYGVEVEK